MIPRRARLKALPVLIITIEKEPRAGAQLPLTPVLLRSDSGHSAVSGNSAVQQSVAPAGRSHRSANPEIPEERVLTTPAVHGPGARAARTCGSRRVHSLTQTQLLVRFPQ